MPAAARPSSSALSTSRTPDEEQLDLQYPSSPLRQHLDPEALPRPDYFDSLDDLHLWFQMRYADSEHDHLEPCKKHSRPSAQAFHLSESKATRPKLVVCHDFKGGYNESPLEQGYSLEHMHLVDTFIYFSHKRVSIPPVGWLAAAARTGTKVLGTLIFEWKESIPELSKLLRGTERKALPLRGDTSFSPQYAVELIKVALEYGFSGYLVNIEVDLDLGFSCSAEAWPAWVGEQARIGEMHKNAERLRAWVHYLREEGRKRFIAAGKDESEWQVMWYDSVVYPHGQLAWQDALTEHNIDFFQAADTFFTNYTWARPPQPLPPGQFLHPEDDSPGALQYRGFGLTGPEDGGWHPQLLLTAAMADSVGRPRNDVYIGIDVFGRNCWGGLKSWKSLDMIGPHSDTSIDGADALGLSVALFAPGWTWEEENAGLDLRPSQKEVRRSWSDWWHIDQAFWLGLPSPFAAAQHRITLKSSDVKPVQKYFAHSYLGPERLGRRASVYGFYTNFCFGSGRNWFDQGSLVHDWRHQTVSDAAGYTDIGVCMPKPDLLFKAWNQLIKGKGNGLKGLGAIKWRFDHEQAWAGNTSLLLDLSTSADKASVPLCSAVVELCSGEADEWTEWTYAVVVEANEDGDSTLGPELSILSDASEVEIESGTVSRVANREAWNTLQMRVRLRHQVPENDNGKQRQRSVTLSLGLAVDCKGKEQVQLRVGAMQLAPVANARSGTRPALQVIPAANILIPPASVADVKRLQPVVLDWRAPLDAAASTYFNVWVQAVSKPETRVWLGTSTREASNREFCLSSYFTLPASLATEAALEYIITSLDILGPHARIIALAPALII